MASAKSQARLKGNVTSLSLNAAAVLSLLLASLALKSGDYFLFFINMQFRINGMFTCIRMKASEGS